MGSSTNVMERISLNERGRLALLAAAFLTVLSFLCLMVCPIQLTCHPTKQRLISLCQAISFRFN